MKTKDALDLAINILETIEDYVADNDIDEVQTIAVLDALSKTLKMSYLAAKFGLEPKDIDILLREVID